MENELKELNFNSLLILDENVQEYDFNKYLANGEKEITIGPFSGNAGAKHKIKGFCTSCEEKGINVCPKDNSFSLKNISHGAMSDDIILATGQHDIDFSGWKDDAVMFVMENPSIDWGFYEEHEYNGFTKKPTKEWYWVHSKQKRIEFPKAFQGGEYGSLFNSIIFTFKLKRAYLTNIVKCGMNNAKNEYKGTNDYQQSCIKNCCDRYLSKEIEILDPKVIFCFGNNAENRVRALLKDKDTVIIGLPHPARQKAGFKNVYYKHLYYTRLLQGLWAGKIYTIDEAGDKFKEFLKNYMNK